MKRQRWVHQSVPGHLMEPGIHINTCPICRDTFNNPCPDCAGKDPEVDAKSIEMVFNTKQLWYIMLLYARRPPFNMLDRALLTQIYKMAIPEQQVIHKCQIVQLSCGHIYHRHCIGRWLAKRQCCPMDNKYMTVEDMAVSSRPLQLTGDTIALVETYQVSNDSPDFISRSALYERKTRAQTMVVRMMKNTSYAKWPLDALYQYYVTNLPGDEKWIRMSELNQILEELCAREFLKQIASDVFQYNP